MELRNVLSGSAGRQFEQLVFFLGLKLSLMSFLPFISSVVVGYFLGALPFGYFIAKAHGVNIFEAGSGAPGATNVRRVLGAKAGNTVFALDTVKGVLATSWPLLPFLVLPNKEFLALAGVFSAVLGHSFSLFTKFKGGKGVATASGGLLVLIPWPCVIGAASWIVCFYVLRYVSLASILSAATVIVACWLLPTPVPYQIMATTLASFVIIRHSSNVRRLLNGTESRFAKKNGRAQL